MPATKKKLRVSESKFLDMDAIGSGDEADHIEDPVYDGLVDGFIKI